MATRRPIIQHLLLLVVIATAPLVALTLYDDVYARIERETKRAEASLVDAAERTAFDAERFVRLGKVMLSRMAARPLTRALDPGRCDPELGDFLAFVPAFVDLQTIAADGQPVCSGGGASRARGAGGLPVDPRLLDQARRTRALTIGQPEKRSGSEKWGLSLVQPIIGTQGEFQGVVALSVDLLTFGKTRNTGIPGYGAVAGIIDSGGVFLFRSIDAEGWIGKPADGLAIARDAALASQVRTVRGMGADGVERMFSFAPIAGTGWTAFSAMALTEMVAAQWRSVFWSGGLSLVCLVLMSALCVWMARRISRPIKLLTVATRQALSGRWSVPGSAGWPVEISELAIVFGDTIIQRQSVQDRLAEVEERLVVTLNSIADGVIATDLEGRITGMNPSAERLTGWDSAQAAGQPLGDVFRCVDHLTREPVVVAMHEVLSDGKTMAIAESATLLCRDGPEYRIADKASPIHNRTGEIIGLVLVFSDVTEQYAAWEKRDRAAEILAHVGDIAKIGGWQLEVASMKSTWSDQTYRLFGLDPETDVFFGSGLDFAVPEDRSTAEAALRNAIEHGTPWDFESRTIGADGVQRWLHSQGTALVQDGKVVRLTGAVQDISDHKQLEQKLLASEADYRELFQASPLPVWVFDEQTFRFLLVNQAAVRHYGYSESEFLSMTIMDIRPVEDGPRLLSLLADPADRIFTEANLWRHIKKDGSVIEVEISDHRLQFAGQTGRLVQAYDVTERNRAKRAFTEQRLRMMAIVESEMHGIIAVGQDQRIIIFNSAAARIFGCSASDALGQTLDRFIPACHRAAHSGQIRKFGETGTTARAMGSLNTATAMNAVALRANGEEFPIEASISHSRVLDEEMYVVSLRDVSDRVRATRALMEQRLELSELTQRLMNSEEQSSRALAQALHDHLGQTLTAIRLGFDALQGSLPRAAMGVTERGRARLSELIDQGALQVRQVLVDLRPVLLEEMGLAAAMKDEFDRAMFAVGAMVIVFEPDDKVLHHRWPAKVEYAAFMSAREAVANALLHASASRIEVRLTQGSPDLQLIVHDNGIGLAKDRRVARTGHLGLVGMRERAVAIGGHLQVVSTPGEGTTITFRWSSE